MELQDLRCFLAVAQQLNFTRAASLLHITQPTLSRRIRDLEVELGTQLFDRGYHDVSLTDKGLILQKEAYEILQRTDALPSLMGAVPTPGAAADGLSGMLRLGHQVDINYALAQRASERMASLYPGVSVYASRHSLANLRTGLREGAVDVAIMLLSDSDQHRGMDAYRIGESRIVVIVPQDHEFAGRDSIRLEEMAGQDVVMIERGTSPQTVDFVNSRCIEQGFSLHACEYVQSAADVVMHVAAGRGAAFAHSMSTLLQGAGQLGVKVLEISDVDMSLSLVAARRQDDDSPVVGAFLDIIRALAKG